MRHLILPLLAILTLAGCSGPSQNRAAFEANEGRYAKIVSDLPPNGLRPFSIVQYVDHVPTIGFDGNNYRLVETHWTVTYNDSGKLLSREKNVGW